MSWIEDNFDNYEAEEYANRKSPEELWKSILTKFLIHFYLDYEEDTAEDYVDANFVSSIQTKTIKGGNCRITGMPLVYGESFSMKDALKNFKNSLTADEAKSIKIGSATEEYADVEEHDYEKDCTTITITKVTQTQA